MPNADVIVFDNNQNEVARSPTISVREVKTYTRIANNTPFIIGGLIARDDTASTGKVPLLGDVPLVGKLFQKKTDNALKREVIIVITPYVLPEDTAISRNIPKDEDAFDSFGNKLFRDAYRIRDEDVFDLAFLKANQQLQTLREKIDTLIRNNHKLAERYPYNQFVDDRFPGEQILVYRQIYEVIKRKNLHESLATSKIILFRPDNNVQRGFDVQYIENALKEYAQKEFHKKYPNRRAPKDPFKALEGSALILTYTLKRESNEPKQVLREPLATVRIEPCPDAKAYERLLWESNQKDAAGLQNHSIVLRNLSDLTRLKRAIIVKRTVDLNRTEGTLSMKNFNIGRLLLLPVISPDKVELIDASVAQYFYYSDLYYPALEQEMENAINAVRLHLEEGIGQ